MIRNIIKFYTKNVITGVLNKQKDIFKNTYFTQQCFKLDSTVSSVLSNSPKCGNVQRLRFKSKTSKKKLESESDSGSDSYDKQASDEEFLDKNTKVLNINVTSLRVDGILKSALGIARNKIETLFYENKIRVNGNKISKKSATVQEGDEIDLLKGPDLKNPNFMNVARVEILSIKPNEDTISIKIRRNKSLLVDVY